jgi:Family of unknown function (DUF6510)
MEALDGNAIAGLLFTVFGREMTTATATYGDCRARSMVAELGVYLRAPGTVARCRHSDSVVMVFVKVRGITCVDVRGLDGARAVGMIRQRGSLPRETKGET